MGHDRADAGRDRVPAQADAGGETRGERLATRAAQGLPLPFVETRVLSDAGQVPWDGRTMGELHVRGPWVARSYFNDPAEDSKFTADGWFRTGDVVTVDGEGYIRITDRSKDLIKSGGEWISSVQVENALMGHPAVQEAAVCRSRTRGGTSVPRRASS